MNEQNLDRAMALSHFTPYDRAAVHARLHNALQRLCRKVVVLDDDPTGIQTVHDVYVYTDWRPESVRAGFDAQEPIFFILTNSRGLGEAQTRRAHCEIAQSVVQAARETKQDFVLISRSDSTLRGHYPLETQVLREELERLTDQTYDGEIILPFFLEGGRYTVDDVHYVQVGSQLVPAGETEFARDKTFGYRSSNLCEWIEEKTEGAYNAEDVVSISLDELRCCDYAAITHKLSNVGGFGKVIVNAVDYPDVEVFVTALIDAMNAGKRFLFRSAAGFTKVIGGVEDKELLTREELVNTRNKNGGLIVVGSHVHKTSQQLEALRGADFIDFVEFNQHLVVDPAAFEREQLRVVQGVQACIRAGRTVAVYTRRERFDLGTGDREEELRLSMKISKAVTGIVEALTVRPNFIIAKGGITSSDIGTQGLHVRRARVMGQILKGIPVWMTGSESKFPDMPYVIFPGNVGDKNALLEAARKMQPGR